MPRRNRISPAKLAEKRVQHLDNTTFELLRAASSYDGSPDFDAQTVLLKARQYASALKAMQRKSRP